MNKYAMKSIPLEVCGWTKDPIASFNTNTWAWKIIMGCVFSQRLVKRPLKK
jgi:hypothetical protein